MGISTAGIGSGLDVESIVTKLMSTEQGPLTAVTKQKTSYESQISAYGTLKSGLATFQAAVKNLSDIAKFNTQTAVSGDATVVSASSNGAATIGNYSLTVRQLAQPQKISLPGVASVYTPIGSGTLTISFGTYNSTGNTFSPNLDKVAKSLTITPANNTLSGIRDAINAGDLGVNASIVNDGVTNRLVISSKDSGAANSMKISVSDADSTNFDTSGLSQLAYDPTLTAGAGKNLSELQAAKSSIVDIDGITVTKSSNIVTDALEGVTLNLLKVQVGTPVDLTVGRDQTTVEKSVTDFVKAFNDINTTLRNLTKYDSTGKSSGVLLGDATTRSISTKIKLTLTNALTSNGTLNSLSQIGVSFQKDGTLLLDSTKLKTAIQNNADGIAGIFASVGKASDGQVSVTGQSANTKVGSYAVNISQLATQGSLSSSSAPNLTITQGVNDQLNLTVNGLSYSLTIPAATYASVDDLAAALQNRVSAAGALAKIAVSGGTLQVTSTNYGSNSTVIVGGGNAAIGMLGATPASVTGLNVAGSINGVAALGSGRTLTGATGDASEGLLVSIGGGALGGRGTVTFSRGYASQLNTLMDGLLGTTGLLASRSDGLTASVTRLATQQTTLQDRLAVIEKRYRAQFTALDKTISGLQQTSTFLTQQIATMTANSKA